VPELGLGWAQSRRLREGHLGDRPAVEDHAEGRHRAACSRGLDHELILRTPLHHKVDTVGAGQRHRGAEIGGRPVVIFGISLAQRGTDSGDGRPLPVAGGSVEVVLNQEQADHSEQGDHGEPNDHEPDRDSGGQRVGEPRPHGWSNDRRSR